MTEKLKQEKRLNLKNDVIFKTFFSRKGNEKFLIDFLNALLKIEINNRGVNYGRGYTQHT